MASPSKWPFVAIVDCKNGLRIDVNNAKEVRTPICETSDIRKGPVKGIIRKGAENLRHAIAGDVALRFLPQNRPPVPVARPERRDIVKWQGSFSPPRKSATVRDLT